MLHQTKPRTNSRKTLTQMTQLSNEDLLRIRGTYFHSQHSEFNFCTNFHVVSHPRPRTYWKHLFLQFILYQFPARLEHFKIFDDVTSHTLSPSPHCRSGPYFCILHTEITLLTNFQSNPKILNFSMTSKALPPAVIILILYSHTIDNVPPRKFQTFKHS